MTSKFIKLLRKDALSFYCIPISLELTFNFAKVSLPIRQNHWFLSCTSVKVVCKQKSKSIVEHHKG